jgi:putative transposase
MEIAMSTYYYGPKISRGEREEMEADLRDYIEQIRVEFPRAGYRMLQGYLQRRGIKIGERRLRGVLRKFGLQIRPRKRFVRTTDSEHGYRVYSNLVKGKPVNGINQVWAADITYIRIVNGFVYLAVILDLYSRKVIGWALSKRIDGDLVLNALRMALERRRPSTGVIHHSDRGVQYLCDRYVALLKKNDFQISCSAKGNPYDNAFAESFMKTLKDNEVYLWAYETYLDVIERVPYFIEEVYNRKRLHSSLGYQTPEEFEKQIEVGYDLKTTIESADHPS